VRGTLLLRAAEADHVGEDHGDHPLRHRGRARVPGVAERDALGHVLAHPVHAGREHLHDLELGQVGEPVEADAALRHREGDALAGRVPPEQLDVVGQPAARKVAVGHDLHPPLIP
jgi:hypothetical protein